MSLLDKSFFLFVQWNLFAVNFHRNLHSNCVCICALLVEKVCILHFIPLACNHIKWIESTEVLNKGTASIFPYELDVWMYEWISGSFWIDQIKAMHIKKTQPKNQETLAIKHETDKIDIHIGIKFNRNAKSIRRKHSKFAHFLPFIRFFKCVWIQMWNDSRFEEKNGKIQSSFEHLKFNNWFYVHDQIVYFILSFFRFSYHIIFFSILSHKFRFYSFCSICRWLFMAINLLLFW